MKKSVFVISAVTGMHVVVVASILCAGGCGTTSPVATDTKLPDPTMPPPVFEPTPPPTKPIKPAAPAARSYTSETTPYIVQKGDSISLIAQRFGVNRAELMGLNHIKDANKVMVGQTLRLPGKVDLSAPRPQVRKVTPAAPKAAKASTTPATATATAGAGEYVVQPGDSLSRIASRQKVSVSALREANSLKGDRILAGQKLKMPGAAAAEVAATPAPVAEVTSAPVAAAAPKAGETPAVLTPPAPPAQAAQDATASAPSFRSYTVEQGEDLYHVSLMWEVPHEELQKLNNLTGTALTPGQVLKIPMYE